MIELWQCSDLVLGIVSLTDVEKDICSLEVCSINGETLSIFEPSYVSTREGLIMKCRNVDSTLILRPRRTLYRDKIVAAHVFLGDSRTISLAFCISFALIWNILWS